MKFFYLQKLKLILLNLYNHYQLKFRKFYRLIFCLFNILIFSFYALSFKFQKEYSYSEKLKIMKFFALLISTITFLLKSFFVDAGDIPIKRKAVSSMDKKELSDMISFQEIKLNNYTIQMKFCRTCMVWRPPRTSHCSLCESCKLKFDHHCPWIGKCIALKNYHHFLFFILYLFWFLVSNFSFPLSNDWSGKNFYLEATMPEKKFEDFITLFNLKFKFKGEIFLEFFFFLESLLKISSFFASLFTGALLLFHIYLGYTGKTTSEFLKFPDKGIKSWSIRKELINKFYKKKIFTLKEIKFTDKNNFFLLHLDFITGSKIDSNEEKIMNHPKKLPKKIFISLACFFLFFYIFLGFCYSTNCCCRFFNNFSKFSDCLMIIVNVSIKVLISFFKKYFGKKSISLNNLYNYK